MTQVLALVLIAEGLLPFCSPPRWRKLFEDLLKLSDDQIRLMGGVSLGLGMLLIWMI